MVGSCNCPQPCFPDGKCRFPKECQHKYYSLGDRIRAMSDEQLNEFLASVQTRAIHAKDLRTYVANGGIPYGGRVGLSHLKGKVTVP